MPVTQFAFVKELLKRLLPVPYAWFLLRQQQKRNAASLSEWNDMCSRSNGEPRPCHIRELFISHDGGVYPCCFVWSKEFMRLGNVGDPDLERQIREFDACCACERYRFRQALPHEEADYDCINIEFALTCNARCAMCCVNAPGWKGSYNHYEGLTELITRLKPKSILVQGGEVLVQHRSLEWLQEIKSKFPSLKCGLVTNGNAGRNLVPLVERLFDTITISIVGFQSETYHTIMGLKVEGVQQFAEELIRNARSVVILKFLLTPINVHETNLFIDWAVSIGARSIRINDSGAELYMKQDTNDHFWSKVIERSGRCVRTSLSEHAQTLREKGCMVEFDTGSANLFHIDQAFVKEHQLERNLVWTPSMIPENAADTVRLLAD